MARTKFLHLAQTRKTNIVDNYYYIYAHIPHISVH